MECNVFDARFNFPSSWLISGPSMAGKSSFLRDILRNWDRLFTESIDYIYWFYGEHYPALETLKSEFGDKIQLVKDLPNNIDEYVISHKKGVIILDDLGSEAFNSKQVKDFYVKHVHHGSVTIFTTTHNIFASATERMTILRNCHYLVLFKSPLDNSIIRLLANKILPKNPKNLIRIFEHCTQKRYGYLVICGHPSDEKEDAKFRSDIFGVTQKCFIA